MAEEKKLEWMYKGISGIVDREDYLTGRKLDKTFAILEKEENGVDLEHEGDDNIPKTLFSEQATSSSAVTDEVMVDYLNKIREDPLFEMKKRQIEAARKILNNPLKMKKIKALIEATIEDEEKPRGSDNDKDSERKKRSSKKKQKHHHHHHRSRSRSKSRKSKESTHSESKSSKDKHKNHHKHRKHSSSSSKERRSLDRLKKR